MAKVAASVCKSGYRSTVVVPGSHDDGSYEIMRTDAYEANYSNHEEHLFKDHKVTDEICARFDILKRAVQLDVRSNIHPAVLILWDSRTVHQGHLVEETSKWSPPVVKPTIHNALGDEWTQALRKDGYVALGNILTRADVHKACRLLLADIKSILKTNQQVKEVGNCLCNVRDRHLPPYDNTGLRDGNGLAHGDFGWFVRSHPCVVAAWKKLYPGHELSGAPGCLALSPERRQVGKEYGGQWLHRDYAPPLPMRTYQSILVLHPERDVDGASWARLGVQLSMFPKNWQVQGAQENLLVGCINGVPAKASAGVRFGHLQVDNPYPPKALRRLCPALNPTLTQAKLDRILGQGKSARKRFSIADLQKLGSKKLVAALSFEQLVEIVNPRCVELVCGCSSAPKSARDSCLKRPAPKNLKQEAGTCPPAKERKRTTNR